MTEQQEELRLRCLELAVRAPGDPLRNARDFHAFVTGEDAKTPRQLIDTALEAANVR
jgi:hypothetical protein